MPASRMPPSCATPRSGSAGSTGWRPSWRPGPQARRSAIATASRPTRPCPLSRRSSMPRAESFLRSGKVRDLYDIDEDTLLLVASDRISAFDVILPTAIPDKGRVLTGLSRFWFAETASLVPNHLLSTDPAELPAGWADGDAAADLHGRMMIGRRARPLPVEVIVRGYLAGTGWKDYRRDGAICGIALPAGLRESDRLPEP